MPKFDTYEPELLAAFESGRLKSVATVAELANARAAARATSIKDKREVTAPAPGARRPRRTG